MWCEVVECNSHGRNNIPQTRSFSWIIHSPANSGLKESLAVDNLFERIGKMVPQAHVAVYRGTGGIVGGWMLAPVLLLNTTGRKSGKQRTTPLTFLPYGGDFVVIASLGGAPHHPAWWLNLMANSQAQVELGILRYHVHAREAEGGERERLWRRMTTWMPMYEAYQRRTDRRIPVVVLDRD